MQTVATRILLHFVSLINLSDFADAINNCLLPYIVCFPHRNFCVSICRMLVRSVAFTASLVVIRPL